MFVIIITNGCESVWIMGEVHSKIGPRRFSGSDMIDGNVPWGSSGVQQMNPLRSSGVQQMNPCVVDSDDSSVSGDKKEDSDDDSDDSNDKKEDSEDVSDDDSDEDTHNEGQAMKAVVNGKSREFVHAELQRFFVSDLTTDSKIYQYSKNWYVVLGDRIYRLDPDSYQELTVITDNMLITYICGKKLMPPLPYTSAN